MFIFLYIFSVYVLCLLVPVDRQNRCFIQDAYYVCGAKQLLNGYERNSALFFFRSLSNRAGKVLGSKRLKSISVLSVPLCIHSLQRVQGLNRNSTGLFSIENYFELLYILEDIYIFFILKKKCPLIEHIRSVRTWTPKYNKYKKNYGPPGHGSQSPGGRRTPL